jgi:putative addiction module component (TIGR02574 family)
MAVEVTLHVPAEHQDVRECTFFKHEVLRDCLRTCSQKLGAVSEAGRSVGRGPAAEKARYTVGVMSNAAKEILEATLKLDAKERARIAHEIIVSLDEEPAEDGVEQAWEQELAHRAAEIDSGAVKLEPWSKVREDLDGIVRGS